MTSKTFTLTEEKKDLLIKILLGIIATGILIICIILGVYLFKANIYGCGPPVLDPSGFSNWTTGADTIALGCFGQHDIESADFLVSQCTDGVWKPEPPECISLPLHLVCRVERKGLDGTIHMWQRRKEDPLQIYGNLSTSEIDKTNGVYSEDFILSRTTCSTSNDFNITIPATPINANNGTNHNGTNANSHDFIQITFKTQKLVAYKQVDLRVVMIFLNSRKTATLVSATQGDVTLVIPNAIMSSGDWTLDENKDENSSSSVNNKTSI